MNTNLLKVLTRLTVTVFATSLFLSLGCSENSSSSDITEYEGYELVWNDEFNEDGLPNPDYWDYDTGDDGWGNNELQDYTARDKQTARTEDGNLIITAFLIETASQKEYRSARLVTRGKHAWKYGRIEMRAKLPGGTGTWPAFWMLPEVWNYGNGSWPANGEIDIMEYVGYNPGVVHASVHTEARNHMRGNNASSDIMVADAEKEFHTYAIEWTEDKISAYINSYKYFEYTNNGEGYPYWPFDKEFHIILNTAIGGTWGGAQGVDDSIFPQEFVIDYVRVYQQK